MSNLRRVSLYIMYLTDLLALILSFFLGYLIRCWLPHVYVMPEISYYMPLLFVSVISYVIVAFGFLYEDAFLSRRAVQEIPAVFKMILMVVVLDILIMFFTKTSEQYSRVFVGVFLILSFFIDLIFRLIVKKYIFPRYKTSRGSEKLVIVTTTELARGVLSRLDSSEDWRYQIAGLILVDKDCKGEEYEGYKVISDRAHAFEDIENENVDSLLLRLPRSFGQKEWLDRFQDMGKTVYLQLEEFYYNESSRMLDYLGSCAVVSYLPAMPVRGRTLIIKRAADFALAAVLLPVLALITVVLGLLNLLFDHGPLMVSHERIGKNGRRFLLFRYRTLSMHSGKKGETARYSVLGRFLRFTHLDGLPMIWNVFVGDMSFVGPEPVSLGTYIEHDPAVIRNLCARPGVTGLWNLKEQDDSAHFDRNEYIRTWNLKLDMKIKILSIFRLLLLRAKQYNAVELAREEKIFITDYLEFRKPLDYDRTTYEPPRGAGMLLYAFVKRTVDIVGSLAGLILLSPVFLILMLLVIANNGGNPFYGHRRIGQNGKRITVFKFKSMRRDADNLEKYLTPEQLEIYRREFKLDDDPRITRFGNFLRKSSLDELPQLCNILIGDLSIVGPRPVIEEETLLYGKDQAKFLSAKPGLTGYWQAYARNNATYETGERQRMELYYVDHQSLLFDLKILFHTVGAVIRQDGAQ